VLVLVTDGGDTANTVTYAQALEKALRGEVMVYSIIDVPIEASAGRDTGRRTCADYAGRADGREVFLRQCRAGWTRPLRRFPKICGRSICWATTRRIRRRG
jgi:hypothetical protein